jgi:aminoglycoside phosphotransferase family enzyme/predicted kinase
MNAVAKSLNLAERLSALAHPAAFPFDLPPDEPIVTIQTHASVVLLAGDRAYKLKKPENFGFFDYSTPHARRHFCMEEVRLNARLAPDVYLGVAPVIEDQRGSVSVANVSSLDAVPQPGELIEHGRVVDYAVVMRRLPEEATLEARVRSGSATPDLLREVAARVATFHASAQTSERIARFGQTDVIAYNWRENFAQMRPYIGRTLDQVTFDRIERWINQSLAGRARLVATRSREGHVRDCHGDLRLQHIYAFDEPATDEPATERHRLEIIDCIEFNERFRYSDVAAEVAFLTMELDAAGRSDLACVFVDAYVEKSGDAGLREALPFYSCYRACVRGKVRSFELDEPEVSQVEREAARQEAQALFHLAASYASGPTGPVVLMVGGLMGSGKSTLAMTLEQELGWEVISSDVTRKRLLAEQSAAAANMASPAFGAGAYQQGWTDRTYVALVRAACSLVDEGRSVILDATWSSRANRRRAGKMAMKHGARPVFMECVCPRVIALERLARRWQAKTSGLLAADAPSAASDGRPDLYDAQAAFWEPYDGALESPLAYHALGTTPPVTVTTEDALNALEVPHRMCRPTRA